MVNLLKYVHLENATKRTDFKNRSQLINTRKPTAHTASLLLSERIELISKKITHKGPKLQFQIAGDGLM